MTNAFEFANYSWLGKRIDPIAEPWYRFGRVLSLIENHIPTPIQGKWLDAGCQIGQFLKLVEAKYGVAPTGIDDFNEENVVEVCRKYMKLEITQPCEVLDDSWRYFSRRIDQTGFDLDEKFDFISAFEIIEHMVDTDAFIKECRNHLNFGGYLIVTTPNINSLRNRIQVPIGIYPSGMEYRTIVHHVRLYNPSALKSHVEEYGFKLVAISGINFFPAKLLNYPLFRKIDPYFCNAYPSLCGGIIAIFVAC